MNETWLKIITKAWSEDDFKADLLKDTNAVLKQYGVKIPDGVKYKTIEDGLNDGGNAVYYLVLPPKPDENKLKIDNFGRKAQSGDPGF